MNAKQRLCTLADGCVTVDLDAEGCLIIGNVGPAPVEFEFDLSLLISQDLAPGEWMMWQWTRFTPETAKAATRLIGETLRVLPTRVAAP